MRNFINEIINSIKRISKEDEYAYEKSFLEYTKIGIIPLVRKTVNKGNVIFRSRTHECENYFNFISDISFPKNEYVKKYARLNRPFQSIFYGSEDRITSYAELMEYWSEGKNIGDIIQVTIGAWELKRNLDLVIIPIPENEKRITRLEKYYGEYYDMKSNELLTNEGKIISDILYEFLSAEFKKPAKKDLKPYLNTSSFGNAVLFDPSIDGFLYPSVPYDGKGYNFAIRKEIIERGDLELVDVQKEIFVLFKNDLDKHSFSQISTIKAKDIDKVKIIWH